MILLLLVACVYRNSEALADALMSIRLRKTDQPGVVPRRGQSSAGAVVCPQCQATVTAGAKFCRKCGTALSSEKGTGRPTPSTTARTSRNAPVEPDEKLRRSYGTAPQSGEDDEESDDR